MSVHKRIDDGKNGPFSKLSLFFFKRKRFTPIFMLFIIAFGALSYTSLLGREGFPPVSVPISVANGVYFVDDAARVDSELAQPIAKAVEDVDGIKDISTFAQDNFITLFANLESNVGTEEGNQLIQAAIDQNTNLPSEATIEFIDLDAAKFLGEYDVLLSLHSNEGATPKQLEDQASRIVDSFSAAELIDSAESIPLFESGVSPQTGETIVQQTSFGRVGLPGDDGFKFYPSTVIGIRGAGGEELDIFELQIQVEEAVAAAQSELGAGYTLNIAVDFTSEISSQISSLQNNVLTGLIAVAIISLIMISWRVSVLSVIFMISVIFVTSGLLFIFGQTLNTITLFALVLALGLFVDDATIISEAIDANKESKGKTTEIIRRAIRGVGAASASGTMTTILVFVPLLFVSGIIGEFIFLLPLTVIIALIVSLLLSLTLIPYLAQFTILSRSNLNNTGWHNPLPDLIAKMIMMLHTNRKVGVLIGVFMVLLSFGFIMASGTYANKLTFNIFPNSKDSDQIGVNIINKPGNTIQQAEAIADDINEVVIDVVGENLVRAIYGSNGSPSAQASDIFIELVPFRERDIKAPEIIDNLEDALADYPEATLIVSQFDAGPPVERFPFKVQLFSEDIEAARSAGQSIASFLRGREIERSNGTTANITDTDIDEKDSILRKDGNRYIEIGAAFDADDVTALVQSTQDAVEAEFTDEKLAPFGLNAADLEFDFGQESENEESFSSLGPAALFALGAMFILLGLQFRSVLKPLLIFMALPFSLFGVTFGLYITDNPLSFFAMIGLIGLIGIAVNNTILLTDFANQGRRKGLGIVESIAEASRARFRPLLTTTLTTVAALTPLALSDPFWESLAVTIMFGLVSSTILVILSFPYYFIMAELLSSGLKRLIRRRS